MRHRRLARIIRRLRLRNIDDHRADRRCEDHAAKTLLLEDLASSDGRPHGTIVVDAVDVRPLLLVVIQALDVTAYSRIGNGDVQPAKVAGGLLDHGANLSLLADVCAIRLDAHACAFGNGTSLFWSIEGRVENDGDVGTSFGKATHDLEADTSCSAGHESGFASQGKEVEDRSLEVGSVSHSHCFVCGSVGDLHFDIAVEREQ